MPCYGRGACSGCNNNNDYNDYNDYSNYNININVLGQRSAVMSENETLSPIRIYWYLSYIGAGQVALVAEISAYPRKANP
jgi:hypothetical protein